MKEDVKRVLRLEQPLKGTEIARRIGHDRGAVNSFLDKNRDVFTQNAAFKWSLAVDRIKSVSIASLNLSTRVSALKVQLTTISQMQRC
ncbi:hypothetical protein [Paraburkholderia sp. J94]|uniref:hypothetical protein n=1 Tax=Paraburkholderia sp. J94 TaxID=2805441 RepID=UPI002AB05229|nr:hypothetical protein [Paraburkholderia sp. J94]